MKLIVINQVGTPIWAKIGAEFEEREVELEVGEKIQTLQKECTELFYHIFSVKTSANLILKILDYQFCEKQSLLVIPIQLLNCSTGFELKVDRCVCERRLLEHLGNDTVCYNVNEKLVTKNGPIWLRYDGTDLLLS